MFGKIKRNTTDILFSQYIRLKANCICEYCFRKFEMRKLNAHHVRRRRHKTTRWYEPNMVCLCIGCHRKFHEDSDLENKFMIKRLGQDGYKALIIRSKMLAKGINGPDEKLLRIAFRQMIKELEEK